MVVMGHQRSKCKACKHKFLRRKISMHLILVGVHVKWKNSIEFSRGQRSPEGTLKTARKRNISRGLTFWNLILNVLYSLCIRWSLMFWWRPKVVLRHNRSNGRNLFKRNASRKEMFINFMKDVFIKYWVDGPYEFWWRSTFMWGQVWISCLPFGPFGCSLLSASSLE